MSRINRIAIRLISQLGDEESVVKRLPIATLVMTQSELSDAVSNITRGHSAVTEGPVEVAYLPRSRKYQLVNGYHRMVEYLLANREWVEARVSQGDWSLPPRSDRFIYQPDLPFKGLERFIESYILKRL